MTAGPRSIFISLTKDDSPIADALRDALYELFSHHRVRVDYSTNKDYEGGIRHGSDWYRWIHDRVSDCSAAIIILTSTSVRKPWVLYESGAVASSAYGSGDASQKLRPMMFQMSEDAVPSPLKHVQTVRGDDADGFRSMLRELVADFQDLLEPREALQIGERMNTVISSYIERVNEALRIAPLEPSEGVVQEWCKRLDEAASEYRATAVQYLQKSIDVAFGSSQGHEKRPLDVRIHRRLGEMFLDVEMYSEAAAEFELARQLVPRDLFILRAQGQALLGMGHFDDADRVISDIRLFDDSAFIYNAESAALLARWHTQKGNPTSAQRVLQDALHANSHSYYLADLLGQNLVLQGDLSGAKAVYSGVLRKLRETKEANIWYFATRATAYLVDGNEKEVVEALREIRSLRPSPGAVRSIQNGLQRVGTAFGYDSERLDDWIEVLSG